MIGRDLSRIRDTRAEFERRFGRGATRREAVGFLSCFALFAGLVLGIALVGECS